MTCCVRGVPWLHVAPRGLEDAWGQEDEVSHCSRSPAYFQVLVSGTADCYGHFVIYKYIILSKGFIPYTSKHMVSRYDGRTEDLGCLG